MRVTVTDCSSTPSWASCNHEREACASADGDLGGRRTDAIAKAGVAIVPEGRRVFRPLTVAEHLHLCTSFSRRRGPWSRVRVLELFPRLGERLGHVATEQRGVRQQRAADRQDLLLVAWTPVRASSDFGA